MNSGRIGVGVVGCGFVGRGAHVPSFQEIPQAELAAIADSDAVRRDKVARRYRPAAVYDNYTSLVRDPQVQLVVVAVPTPLHAEVALAAIRAGKHVLCEMPLAACPESAEEMITAARQQGVVLMPGLTFRFTPNFARLQQKLREGAVGRPTGFWYREFIPAADLAGQWPPGSWMWDLARSRGPLFTLSVWSIDLLCWLAEAEIAELQAQVAYRPLEALGTLGYDAAVVVRWSNGLLGSLQYSGTTCRAAASCVLEVTGTGGRMLRAVNHDRLLLLADEPDVTEWNLQQSGARMWGHQQQNAHLIDCLVHQRPPDVTPEDGLRAMRVAGAIVAAVERTG